MLGVRFRWVVGEGLKPSPTQTPPTPCVSPHPALVRHAKAGHSFGPSSSPPAGSMRQPLSTHIVAALVLSFGLSILFWLGFGVFVLVGFITLLVRRRFKLALAVGLAGFLGLVAAYAAVALDSSTLLYAT